jgi:hypothetical protein
MRVALADPARKEEAFLPLPAAGRTQVLKRAAVTLPKPEDGAIRR